MFAYWTNLVALLLASSTCKAARFGALSATTAAPLVDVVHDCCCGGGGDQVVVVHLYAMVVILC